MLALRLIAATTLTYVLGMGFALSGYAPAAEAAKPMDGQAIFRYDTFGDEQLWTDVLRMQEAIATVPPATALAVGLKVDVDALPARAHVHGYERSRHEHEDARARLWNPYGHQLQTIAPNA